MTSMSAHPSHCTTDKILFGRLLTCHLLCFSACTAEVEVQRVVEPTRSNSTEDAAKKKEATGEPTTRRKAASERKTVASTIVIDPRECTATPRSLSFGMGSLSIKTTRADNGACEVRHIAEIEGGETRHFCQLAADSERVIVTMPSKRQALSTGEKASMKRLNLDRCRELPSRSIFQSPSPELLCEEKRNQDINHIDSRYGVRTAGRCGAKGPVGEWKQSTLASGQLISVIPFNDAGRRDGIEIGLYTDGREASRVEYRDGKQHGNTVDRWRNGNKRREYTNVDGHMTGNFASWFEDGKKQCEGPKYKDGAPFEGRRRCWSEDGTLDVDETYREGRLIRKVSHPYSDKRIKSIMTVDANGVSRNELRGGPRPGSPQHPHVSLSSLSERNLVAALENVDHLKAWNASVLLGKRGKAAVKPLRRAANSRSEKVRRLASYALVQIDSPEAARASLPQLWADLNSTDLATGSQAFARVNKAPARERVVKVFEADIAKNRKKTMSRLRRHLRGESIYARKFAAMVLGELGREAAPEIDELKRGRETEKNALVAKDMDVAIRKIERAIEP